MSCPYMNRLGHREGTRDACTRRRGQEWTRWEGGPFASQGEKPQERPNLTTPWSWIYSLQNCEKISFCDFSHPVWSILLWQSNQTDTLTLFIKRKKWKQSKYSPTGKWTFSPGGPVIKNPPAKAGDMGSIPGQEDPTCHEAAKPLCHNYWNPQALKPILCSKRCHCNHHKYRKDLCSNEDLTQPEIKKQNKKLSKGKLSPCVFRFQSPKFRRENLIHLLKHSQWPVPRGLATGVWNEVSIWDLPACEVVVPCNHHCYRQYMFFYS